MLQSMREPFGNWAQGAADRVANVLNEARAEHTNAVKERLNAVAQMKDVVSLTEGLFALSKVRRSAHIPQWPNLTIPFS